MCSGRVDLEFILRAFSNGQDGVFIGGCKLDECNYITHGNYDALSVTYLCKKIMEHIGLNPERLRIQFMSGADGNLLAEVADDFTRKVKTLGPLGKGEGLDEKGMKLKLEAARKLVPYIRLVERERLRLPAMAEEAYQTFFASDELKRIFAETIIEKLALGQIVSLLRKGPLTTGEIAQGVGLTPSEVSKHLSTSSRHRLVRYDESQKRYALA